MKTQYLIGTLFWIVVAFFIAIEAYRLGLGHFHHPGPGFIFFFGALLIIILGTIDLAINFTIKEKRGEIKKIKPLWSGLQWGKVLLALSGLIIYIYVLKYLGFFLSVFLLSVLLFNGVGSSKWWMGIGLSLITSLFFYLLFQIGLNIPFPQGFLNF